MTSADRSIDQAAADYARHRAFAIEAQRRVTAISATMTSPQGTVTVTVGSQGELKSLTFNSQDFRRMPPAELSKIILDTVDRARQSAMRQVLGEMPEPYGGMSFADVLDGTVDLDRLLPERLDVDGMPLSPGRGTGHGGL